MGIIKLSSVAVLCIFLNSCQTADNKWATLFDGETLSGWEAVENPASFTVNEGQIVAHGPQAFLYYTGKAGQFKNFELDTDVKTAPGAGSGIYFHTKVQNQGKPETGYEVKINNSYKDSAHNCELWKTGSLSLVRNVYYPFVKDNEWFNIRIKVVENQVEVFVNGTKVVDYIQPDHPWRAEGEGKRLLGEGSFALQASGGSSTVYFKNIKVRRLPPGKKQDMPVDEGWDTTVTKLMANGFPLIDYHVHLKGGLSIEEAVRNSQRLGINYGIAPNCGLHFPVTNDSSLIAYIESVDGFPIYKGMQAEGREWVTLFSPEAVARFDYVFTDAMTFTDYKGRRNRIWIPEEVWVDDKEQFMEQLVGKIEAIFSQEPVDIYVNPTVLPAIIEDDYDQLWTKSRKERVIKVLAENNIALEINARYKLPKADMIKMAKEAGVKFSFGTNNTGRELGKLEYCLQMIEECGLTPQDMFMPKPHSQKQVLLNGLPKKITG
ncbi:MAG: DUF1080 domain-containing protein [Chlorobi bacterium]|nr:DUF1080 domain-containing protein [Chlorobiota bacterium]